MKKRALSLLLAFAMLVSLLPVATITAEAASSPCFIDLDGNGEFDITTEKPYKSVQAAVEAAGTTPTDIVLIANVGYNNVTIAKGQTITLNLNGYVLMGTGEGSVITNNGTLTITDTSLTTTRTDLVHYYTVDAEGLWTWDEAFSGSPDYTFDAVNGLQKDGVATNEIPASGTNIAVKGGAITGGNGTALARNDAYSIWNVSVMAHCGGGILNFGTLTVNNINIVGNQVEENDAEGGGICNFSELTVSNSAIIGNVSNRFGAGIFTRNEAEISDSKISYNTNTNSSIASKCQGGGIYHRIGILDITDSEIIGNTTSGSGAGVSNYSAGTVEISDSIISGNKATRQGGGIYNNSGILTVSGTVSGNEAAFGAGICNFGIATLSDISITENKSTFNGSSDCPGGGLYSWSDAKSDPLNFAGVVKITGNTTTHNGNTYSANLCLSGETQNDKIVLSGIASGSLIGVTTMVNDTVTTGVFSAENSEDYSTYFVSDNADYIVYNDGRDSQQKLCIRIKVAVPEAITGLVYNGQEQCGLATGTDLKYTITGNTATDIGNYTATVSLKDKINSVWGTEVPTTTDLRISWSIGAPCYTVTFDSMGGTGIASVTNLSLDGTDTVTKPTDPTREESTFNGWYLDGKLYDFTKPVTKDLTLEARWILNETGNQVGKDTIIATEYDENDTTTRIQVIGDPDVKASGIESVAKSEKASATDMNIKIVLSASETSETDVDETEKTGIQQEAKKEQSDKKVTYFDIDLTRYASTGTDLSGNGTAIHDTGENIIEVIIPFDMTGKDNIAVYRYHDNQAESFVKKTDKAEAGADGTFYVDGEGEEAVIHIFTTKFSTYAVGYTVAETNTDTDYYTPATKKTCPKDETCVYAKFTDAVTTEWYHDGVHFCVEKGYMNGITETLFGPNDALSRGMIVTMLWRMEGKPFVDYAMTFIDVDAEYYYVEAIRWAESVGIVTGYNESYFGPESPVTREELATILYRYAKYKGKDVSIGENTNILSYDDAINGITEYAIPAMQWAVGSGIINGIDNKLEATESATRAQGATMLYRLTK